MIKKLLITIGLITIMLNLFAATVSAYQIDPSYQPINSPFSLKDDIKDKGSAGALVVVLQMIASGLLYFAAPIAIIMLGFGAFNMVSGSGESEKIDQAKKHLTWSLIGLIVIILSYSIVKIVITLAITNAST